MLSACGFGESCRGVRRGEFRKRAEFPSPSLGHFLTQVRLEVGEELERRAGRPFLPHEHERRHGRCQQERDRSTPRRRIGCMVKPVAEGAIPNLIVILNTDDRSAHRDAGRIGPARLPSMPRRLA